MALGNAPHPIENFCYLVLYKFIGKRLDNKSLFGTCFFNFILLMDNFRDISVKYVDAQAKLINTIRATGTPIPEIAEFLNSPISTVYNKINGNSTLLHEDMLHLSKKFNFDILPFITYEDYLISFSAFIEQNKIFRQDYFLSIINKDNKGLKKRFQKPLLWQENEVLAILTKLKSDLLVTPFSELLNEKS